VIASVEGVVGAIAADSLVIETGGIGYRIFCSPSVILGQSGALGPSGPRMHGKLAQILSPTRTETGMSAPTSWASACTSPLTVSPMPCAVKPFSSRTV